LLCNGYWHISFKHAFGLENMKFGDVPLIKALYFYVIKNMDALFSWYLKKT
jgi:hypothetical protein